MRRLHPAESHDPNFGFCPATSQLYRKKAKLSQDNLYIADAHSWQTDVDRLIDGPSGGWNRFLYERRLRFC
jgi:hypothetical protein